MTVHRAHTILFVADPVRSVAFYRRVLALEPTLDVEGMTEFELAGGAVFGLMPEAGVARLLGDGADPRRASGPSRFELYLVVDDAAAHLERALAAGAREVSPLALRDWGHRAGYVRDPDGHLVAFAEIVAP